LLVRIGARAVLVTNTHVAANVRQHMATLRGVGHERREVAAEAVKQKMKFCDLSTVAA
jgi:S1-C subfamily serine protease